MASALTLQDLPALADYTRERERFRAEVLSAKKARYVPVGENVSLLFESRLTVLYQVMEMLRIEKTTDPQGIQSVCNSDTMFCACELCIFLFEVIYLFSQKKPTAFNYPVYSSRELWFKTGCNFLDVKEFDHAPNIIVFSSSVKVLISLAGIPPIIENAGNDVFT